MSEKDRIPELFGSMSFNEGTMEQYVPYQAMEGRPSHCRAAAHLPASDPS